MRCILPVLIAALPAAAQAQPLLSAEQAIANYEERIRLARAGICRSAPDPEVIVICGQRLDDSRYRIDPGIAPAALFYRSEGPPLLLDTHVGPLRIRCCAIATDRSAGAGLSLSISF